MTVFSGSLNQIARQVGMTPERFLAHRVDKSNIGPAIRRVAARIDQLNGRQDKQQRLDSKQVADNATAFVTSALSETLTPIERVSNEKFLFVPGMTGGSSPLLPVQQKVPWGKRYGEWAVVTLTGEARNVSPGGLNSLTYVGSSDEQQQFRTGMYGVRMKWDEFELMQAGHLGRDVPGENRAALMQAMAEKMEREGSFGDESEQRQGFLNTGRCKTFTLAKGFGDPTLTFKEAFEQLSIMHLFWTRANPNRGVTGVIMPETHRLNLLGIFRGTDGDLGVWKYAMEVFPWLANIVPDDRLLTASPTNGPMWQMWSADSEELWYESTPSPTLFGPFELSPLETEFIALAQTAAIVNRRAERIERFYMPV